MVLATQRKDVRRGRADVDTIWDEMDRQQRFQLLDQLGAQILPSWSPPDIRSPRNATDVHRRSGARNRRRPGRRRPGKLRRAVIVKSRTALVQWRSATCRRVSDPDALIVPDHL